MPGIQRLPNGIYVHGGIVRGPCLRCCGQGPCGSGQPECCQTNPRPPGCVPHSGQNTPRLDQWHNGVLTQTVFPPDRNCCCGPASGRFFRIEREERVWTSPGWPTVWAPRGWVRFTASGIPDALGFIPYQRTTYDAATGINTEQAGAVRVVVPGSEICVATRGEGTGQFPPPGFGWPTCYTQDLVGDPPGTGQWGCRPIEGFKFGDCYHFEQDLWSEIILTTPTGSMVQAISQSRESLTINPNNGGCRTPACPPRGACCCGGICFHLTAAECATQRGEYAGDGSLCEKFRCTTLGQCCLPDGQCADTTRGTCARLGGLWSGRGTTCAHSPPCNASQTWKCCLPNGVCTNATAAACQRLHGTPYPGLLCGQGGPCQVQSTGACCLPEGGCGQINVTQCAALGGIWQGEGSDCGGAGGGACLTGACCIPTSHGMDCDDTGNAATCANAQGTYMGNGTTCASNPCGIAGKRSAALWTPESSRGRIVVPWAPRGSCGGCFGNPGRLIS